VPLPQIGKYKRLKGAPLVETFKNANKKTDLEGFFR
jgi:hypothetical protein